MYVIDFNSKCHLGNCVKDSLSPIVLSVLEAEFKDFRHPTLTTCPAPRDASVILTALEKRHGDSSAHLVVLLALRLKLAQRPAAQALLARIIQQNVRLASVKSAEALERYARLFGLEEAFGVFARCTYPHIEFK